MYTDLHYISPKQFKAAFGLTDGQFTKLCTKGKLRFKRKYKNPLIYADSIASLYEERSTLVLKRWGYDYESPRDKHQKMLDKLGCFPRCFFRVENIPDGYYRAFYKNEEMRLLVFVFDGFARCLCYTRKKHANLETLFWAYENNNIDIEG